MIRDMIQFVGEIVLAVGLTARSNCHIAAAHLNSQDPNLATSDLTTASPTVALRDNSRIDLTARLLSFAVGCIGMWMFFRLAHSPTTIISTTVWAFVAINAAVVIADPLWFVVDSRRQLLAKLS